MAVVANATAPDTLPPATELAVVANATAPDTLPPVTEFALAATVALATVPVTLAPGILVNPAPDPLNCEPVT